MDRQTLRDWVIRYNEDGLDGLADRARDGRPPKLDAEEKAELLSPCARRPGSGGRAGFRPSRARIWCAFARSGSARACM